MKYVIFFTFNPFLGQIISYILKKCTFLDNYTLNIGHFQYFLTIMWSYICLGCIFGGCLGLYFELFGY
jgi:hypothetical protein